MWSGEAVHSRRWILGVISLISLFCSPAFSLNTLRYSGFVRHDSIQRDQYVTLDLVANPNPGGSEPTWLGLLKFYFGDLRSREYISFHFDTAHLHGDWLVLDQLNQEVSVNFPKFSEEKLEGTLRTSFTTEHPQIILQREGLPAPKYPLMEALWGEYEGTCKAHKEKLQLFTYRSTEETTKTGHPFSDYVILGELGVQNPALCFDSPFCIKNQFFSGAYNFYTQNLELFGRYGNERCEIIDSSIKCGECVYKKTASEDASMHPTPAGASAQFPTVTGKPFSAKDVQGSYQGYLYHEALNEYQAANVDFFLLPPKTPNGPMGMSSLFRIYFGDFTSQEALTYRYDPIYLPDNTTSFLLAKPTLTEVNEMDAVLEVTQVSSESISGVWYSLLFGRIGTFYLHKSKPPKLPEGATTVGSLTGEYRFENLSLNVGVVAEKVASNLENPFSPLNFVGRLLYLDNVVAAKDFRKGSYDFYTGRLALFLEQKDRYLIGNRESATTMELRVNTLSYLSPLLPFEGRHFELQPKR